MLLKFLAIKITFTLDTLNTLNLLLIKHVYDTSPHFSVFRLKSFIKNRIFIHKLTNQFF